DRLAPAGPGAATAVWARQHPSTAVAGPTRPPNVVNWRGWGGRSAVGALLGDAGQEGPHLRLAVAAVAPEGADRGQLAGLGPAGDGLGVDTEHRGDLGR